MVQIVPYHEQYEPQLKALLRGFEIEVEHKRTLPSSVLEVTFSDEDDDLSELIDENVEDALAQINAKGDDCYLALSPEGAVLGFQMTHLYHNKADAKIRPGDLEVSRLYVHPDFRKQGIARMLDEHCLERAKGVESVNRVITFVEEGNPNTALKKELGFRRTSGYQDGARVYHLFQKAI